MNPSPASRAFYLQQPDSPDRAAFAVLHTPQTDPRPVAILLCPPFGWEDMCSYRIRRQWAEQLARDGYNALRIDLPGSGDSAGAPRDPGQLEAWTEAVAGAAHWLRHARGAQRVAAIGIGLGGLVAARAALRGAPIDELALWAVPARGRTLLRELRAFSAFEVASNPSVAAGALGAAAAGAGGTTGAATVGAAAGDASGDGTLAINGYLLSAETVAELGALDLARVERAESAEVAPARLGRALVLGRDGMKVPDALPDALRSTGAEVTVADGPGYGALMVEPQDARTPVEVIERVGAWLREGEHHDARQPPGDSIADADGGAAPRAARALHTTFATPTTSRNKAGWGPKSKQQPASTSPHEGPASAGVRLDRDELAAVRVGVPLDRGELEIECGGVALRERPVLLDGPDGPLFGVLAEPRGERCELTAVLLNAGPQRRTGPNRMWVEIARRWAAQGVPSLRLDCAGIGDSDGDSAVLARVAEFYRPAYAQQARAALDALAARGLPPRFVMVGLCAGGYWSVQAALADERVAAVAMLNPRTLVFDEWRHARRRTGHLRAQALRASTWRRLLRGEIKFAKHLETGRTLLGRAASAPVRAGGRARGRLAAAQGGEADATASVSASGANDDAIETLFDALRQRHQRGLLLFTGGEILRRELTERGVLERIGRWPNLRLALKGTDVDTHTLTPVWLQHEIHALLDEFLTEQLRGLPSPGGHLAARSG